MSDAPCSLKTVVDDDGLATITFSSPNHNALPSLLLEQLSAAIYKYGYSREVELILLESHGTTFCAGASLEELLAVEDETSGYQFFSGFANVINACRHSEKLILCRVQGKAVGGGVGLAAAADYAFATEKSAVRLSELNIGIGPFVIEPAVTRKIGLSSFTQLSLNPGSFFDAHWCFQKGLYHSLSANDQAMDDAIRSFVSQLKNTNPEARKELKRAFWKGTKDWDSLLSERAKTSGRLVLSEYTKQALESYR